MNKEKIEKLKAKVNEFFSSKDIDAEVVTKENPCANLLAFCKDRENGTLEKFEDVTLVDGETMLTVEPAIEVGAAVVLQTAEGPIPAPAGAYELEDGRVINVVEGAEGVIDSLEENAPEEEEPMAQEDPKEQVKRVIERIEKEKIFSKNEAVEELTKVAEFLKTENEELKKELVELKKFVTETFSEVVDLVGAEPSKEPVQETKEVFSAEIKEDMVEQWISKYVD